MMQQKKPEEALAGQVKILVVDDREDNLLSIETILEQDGYTIVKANSGKSALKILLTQHDFMLILMDVQMPGMDGMETATLISQREKLRHIPIIFITAHSYEEDLIFQGYQMGGVDYIYKPINPELLRIKVGVFVELYRKNHQLLMQERKLLSANQRLEKEIEERKLSEEKIKLLNHQLLQNNQHLKKTNEELDRFAYVASHDLQEPLRKISIFTDRFSNMMSESLNGEVKTYLDKIIQATERMKLLVNDLLNFSRQKEDSYDYQKTDLNIILKEVLTDMEVDIETKKVKIESVDLPSIDAIPSLIRQLFQNLLSNSIKFCRKDCVPEISIRTEEIMQPDSSNYDFGNERRYYQIYISDNGIGFDTRYVDEIFIAFKRLHSQFEYTGSGIGLSICKKIVEKHHGYITAMSTVNEGSTFVITLPEKINIESGVYQATSA